MGDSVVRRSMSRAVWRALPAVGLTSVIGAVVAPSATAQHVAAATAARATVATQTVTIDVEKAPLPTVIHLIARRAGLVPAYDEAVLPTRRRVTLHLQNVSAAAAFQAALQGTGLVAQVQTTGDVAIVPGSGYAMGGIVTGVVIDAVTKRPVAGATVTIDGTKVTVRTAEDGTFRLEGVTAGTHHVIVRRIGYQGFTSTVEVKDDASVSVSVLLSTATTRLTEVVTTADGKQRRLEVGHVISHLNVDSIAPNAPITSVTDLLSGRSPGVQVMQTNGLAGSSVGIRIRGQSSLTLNSDPIVIVDGVRQDNSEGGGFNGMFGSYASPSRLNDLDYSQIESIDILKGPAASTQYGTDAANGVIVVTTKRGQAGKPQWHASGERGWSEVPTDFPDFWYTYGHWTPAGTAATGYSGPVGCQVVNSNSGWASQLNGWCAVDSVTHDNPLNHPFTTVYGTGERDRLSLDVGGGTDALRYYLAGATSRDVGTIRLPIAFRSQARNLGFPSQIFDPNTQNQRSVRSNVNARLSPTLDLTLNGAYLSTDQVAPAAAASTLMPGRTFGATVLDSAHFYGYGDDYLGPGNSPLNSLGSWTTEGTQRATTGLRADWRPTSWFTGYVTTGLDHGSQRMSFLWSPQAVEVANGQHDKGWLAITNSTTDIYSSDMRGSVSLPVTASLRSVTSVGYQVAKTTNQGTTASVEQVTSANMTLNGVPDPNVTESGTGTATVGGYLEEQVNVAERLFLNGAFRLDGASGFGHDYHTTVYPKFSASWLVLNDGEHTVRIRAAFGTAGKQPDNGTSLQTFYATTSYVDGSNQSTFSLTSPGNPNLRPERSRELEGGIDIGLWDSRVNLELTHYSKHTTDALTGISLGGTLGSLSTQENLGDVQNWGNEATLQVSLVRTASTTWDVTVNASQNRNKLLRLAQDAQAQPDDFMQNERNVVGYPLYGFWARRATYKDANGDGLIVKDEITLSDTAVYIGSSTPQIETSWSSSLGLFRGALTLNALFDQRAGGLAQNGERQQGYYGTLRADNDPHAPLLDQARDRACQFCTTSLNFETGWFVRFRELSATVAIPTRWIRMMPLRNLSLTTAVRNLALWTHYTGADPESSDPGARRAAVGVTSSVDARGSFGNAVPMPREWVVRFNTGF